MFYENNGHTRNERAETGQKGKGPGGKGRWWNQLIKSEAEVTATTSLPLLLKWKLITAMAFRSLPDVREPIIRVLDDPAITFFTIYYSLHESFSILSHPSPSPPPSFSSFSSFSSSYSPPLFSSAFWIHELFKVDLHLWNSLAFFILPLVHTWIFFLLFHSLIWDFFL